MIGKLDPCLLYTSILFRMKDDIFNARRQFRELNKVMEQLTYGEEVYRFELEPSRDPQLAAFYQVIVDKGNQQMTEGDSLDNLAATADPAYERQVDELMEKIMADVDENTRARQEGRTAAGATLSDYVDYRTYLDYDIKVTNPDVYKRQYPDRELTCLGIDEGDTVCLLPDGTLHKL